jgi:hypothetical protein
LNVNVTVVESRAFGSVTDELSALSLQLSAFSRVSNNRRPGSRRLSGHRLSSRRLSNPP